MNLNIIHTNKRSFASSYRVPHSSKFELSSHTNVGCQCIQVCTRKRHSHIGHPFTVHRPISPRNPDIGSRIDPGSNGSAVQGKVPLIQDSGIVQRDFGGNRISVRTTQYIGSRTFVTRRRTAQIHKSSEKEEKS